MDIGFILISIIFMESLLFVVISGNVSQLHKGVERDIDTGLHDLHERVRRIRKLKGSLDRRKKELHGKEREEVFREIEKIKNLWKSRRECLRMGFWEQVATPAGELEKLEKEREIIQELIKKAKLMYHKREIDEESFREIIKDYQKQLMENSMKIKELKSQ